MIGDIMRPLFQHRSALLKRQSVVIKSGRGRVGDRRGNAMKLARLTLCAGAFAILSSYAAAKPAYVLTTVNMRSGPATTNDIVAKIPAGSLVEANNCNNGWCEVSWQ